MKLHLGCGLVYRPDCVNVDISSSSVADQIVDLNRGRWPWNDEAATDIFAVHVFEHVVDPLGFMAESWRVLEVGGLLHLEVPHWQSRNAFTDPTHKRFCTEETFRYWVPGNWLSDMGGDTYSRGCWFDEVSNVVESGDLRVVLRKRYGRG